MKDWTVVFDSKYIGGSKQAVISENKKHWYQPALVPFLFPVTVIPGRFNTQKFSKLVETFEPEMVWVPLYAYHNYSYYKIMCDGWMFKTEFDALSFITLINPDSFHIVKNLKVK
jgi:hypothetical protein